MGFINCGIDCCRDEFIIVKSLSLDKSTYKNILIVHLFWHTHQEWQKKRFSLCDYIFLTKVEGMYPLYLGPGHGHRHNFATVARLKGMIIHILYSWQFFLIRVLVESYFSVEEKEKYITFYEFFRKRYWHSNDNLYFA